MNNLNYEITRLEEFYNLYKSSNMDAWLKDLVLPLYEEKLTNFYTKRAYPSKLAAL
jgi:hypothetical protein